MEFGVHVTRVFVLLRVLIQTFHVRLDEKNVTRNREQRAGEFRPANDDSQMEVLPRQPLTSTDQLRDRIVVLHKLLDWIHGCLDGLIRFTEVA